MTRAEEAPLPSWRTSYGPLAAQTIEWTKPGDPARTAVLIALHGGYWRARYGLEHLRPFCSALAGRGFLVASLEYRRLGEAGGGWPGTLDDVEHAVASALNEVAREGYHTSALLVGHSAGGQLALWAASRLKAKPRSGVLPLGGVVALAPVSDLAEAFRLKLSDGVVRELLGGSPEEVPERYRAVSPVEVLPLGVRTVLVHGTLDEDVPYGLSPPYVQRARAAGDEARLVTLEGAGHFDVIEPDSRCWPEVLGAIESLD
jgi:acetyl esterase/lipase